MPFPTEITEMKPDLLVTYLTELFTELRFDDMQPDGTLYCSDSNASVDPHEVANHLRKNFGSK